MDNFEELGTISLEEGSTEEVEPQNMLDPVVVEPQEKVEPKEKPKVEPKSEEQSSLEKQAGYFSRHPEKFQELAGLVNKTKSVDKGSQALQEIHQLKMDVAVKDAVIDYGLEKSDFAFIKGDTPEELLANAKAFSEYKKSLGGSKDESKKDSTDDAKTNAVNRLPDKPIEYPTYSKNSGEKLSLREQFLSEMPKTIKLD